MIKKRPSVLRLTDFRDHGRAGEATPPARAYAATAPYRRGVTATKVGGSIGMPAEPMHPPTYLHAAAKQAWADILEAAPQVEQADDRKVELAAVLLAQFRRAGLRGSLQAHLSALLRGLGLSMPARFRIFDERAF